MASMADKEFRPSKLLARGRAFCSPKAKDISFGDDEKLKDGILNDGPRPVVSGRRYT